MCNAFLQDGQSHGVDFLEFASNENTGYADQMQFMDFFYSKKHTQSKRKIKNRKVGG